MPGGLDTFALALPNANRAAQAQPTETLASEGVGAVAAFPLCHGFAFQKFEQQYVTGNGRAIVDVHEGAREFMNI